MDACDNDSPDSERPIDVHMAPSAVAVLRTGG